MIEKLRTLEVLQCVNCLYKISSQMLVFVIKLLSFKWQRF